MRRRSRKRRKVLVGRSVIRTITLMFLGWGRETRPSFSTVMTRRLWMKWVVVGCGTE